MSTIQSKRSHLEAENTAFFFWGNQPFELKEEATKYARNFLNEEITGDNLVQFDFRELKKEDTNKAADFANQIQQSAENISFLSPKLVIWIDNLQKTPSPRNPNEKIEKALSQINLVKLVHQDREVWTDADSLTELHETHNHLTAKQLVQAIQMDAGQPTLALKANWLGNKVYRQKGKELEALSIEELLTEKFKGKVAFNPAIEAQMGKEGKLLQQIIAQLETPPENVLFILLANIKAMRELPNALQKVIKAKVTDKKMSILYDDALPTGWVIQKAMQYHMELTPPLAKFFIEICGTDFQLLDQELQKLQISLGSDRLPTEQDILKINSPSLRFSVFRVGEFLSQRDLGQCIQSLEQLLLENMSEAPALFGLITMQFRRLLKIHWLKATGFNNKYIAVKIKLHPFLADRMIRTALSFLPHELENIILYLSTLDLRIKFSKDEALSLLETFAFLVCQKEFQNGPQFFEHPKGLTQVL